MTIAILDPSAGISGDMTLAALLAAGVDSEWLKSLPSRLGISGVRVRIDQVQRATLAATSVRFETEQGGAEGGHGRHVGELIEMVRLAPLSDAVKQMACRAFELVGEAEGAVHGIAPERVHLHEVGAVDAVLDIVGAIEGFEKLGVDAVYHLPVAVGNGWTLGAHGHLPVPAPATLRLLEGLDVRHGPPVTGEATTPTGAALVRVLSAGSPPRGWRVIGSYWGAGARNPPEYPNALRLILADVAAEAGALEVIATDLDDLSPEYIEPLREAVFAAGAVDCVVWTTQGKKGRVSIRVEALAPPDAAELVVSTLFAHSTTAGVRRWGATRSTLARREVVVELDPRASIRIKVWAGPFGTRIKPEYGDVVRAASLLGRPALDVANEARRLAEVVLQNGEHESG